MSVSSMMRTENGIDALTPHFATAAGACSPTVGLSDCSISSSEVEELSEQKFAKLVSSVRLRLFPLTTSPGPTSMVMEAGG